MIRGGHFWVGLSTDRACVVVRTYMLNVNTSEPYRACSKHNIRGVYYTSGAERITAYLIS